MRGANGRDTRRNMLRGSTNIHRVSTLKDTRLQGPTSRSIERLVETPCGLVYPPISQHSKLAILPCDFDSVPTCDPVINAHELVLQVSTIPLKQKPIRSPNFCVASPLAQLDHLPKAMTPIHSFIHPYEALETHDVPVSSRSPVDESDSVSLYMY